MPPKHNLQFIEYLIMKCISIACSRVLSSTGVSKTLTLSMPLAPSSALQSVLCCHGERTTTISQFLFSTLPLVRRNVGKFNVGKEAEFVAWFTTVKNRVTFDEVQHLGLHVLQQNAHAHSGEVAVSHLLVPQHPLQEPLQVGLRRLQALPAPGEVGNVRRSLPARREHFIMALNGITK